MVSVIEEFHSTRTERSWHSIRMWQSQVEIEHYSVVYLNPITTVEVS